MTKPFLIYAMGASGGSWLADVLNSRPGIACWEEPRRKLDLPTEWGADQIEAHLLEFYQGQLESGEHEAVGFIKGFRQSIVDYCLAHGGRILYQYRHPIKVLHGKRHRRTKAEVYFGTDDLDDQQIWEGICCKTAERYRAWHAASGQWPLVRLEDMTLSLAGDGRYVQQVLEYITQVAWSNDNLRRVFREVLPRDRRTADPVSLAWQVDWEAAPSVPWEQRRDPPAAEIWAHWDAWQRDIFIREFQAIMLSGGYALP
jgi:hypothetical protein